MKTLPPDMDKLPYESRRVFEFCLGRVYHVDEIDQWGQFVLDVSADIDHRFGGFMNDIRMFEEELEVVGNGGRKERAMEHSYHPVHHESLEEAEQRFREEAAGSDGEGYVALAHFLAATDRPNEAEAAFRQAIDRGVDVLIEYGNLLVDELDRPEDAEAVYRRAIATGEPYVHAILGNLLRDMGRIDEAIEEYRKGIGLGDSLARNNYGVLLRKMGFPAQAESELKDAMSDGYWPADVSLADLYADLGRNVEAEVHYRRAIANGVKEARVNYGTLLADVYRPHEAVAQYEAVIADRDDLGLAYFNLGNVYLDLGQGKRAEKYYRKAIEHGEVKAHAGLAATLASRGKMDEAERHFRQGIEAGDDSGAGCFGKLLLSLGRYEEAEQYLGMAGESNPQMKNVLPLIYSLEKQDKTAEAEAVRSRVGNRSTIDAI